MTLSYGGLGFYAHPLNPGLAFLFFSQSLICTPKYCYSRNLSIVILFLMEASTSLQRKRNLSLHSISHVLWLEAAVSQDHLQPWNNCRNSEINSSSSSKTAQGQAFSAMVKTPLGTHIPCLALLLIQLPVNTHPRRHQVTEYLGLHHSHRKHRLNSRFMPNPALLLWAFRDWTNGQNVSVSLYVSNTL